MSIEDTRFWNCNVLLIYAIKNIILFFTCKFQPVTSYLLLSQVDGRSVVIGSVKKFHLAKKNTLETMEILLTDIES